MASIVSISISFVVILIMFLSLRRPDDGLEEPDRDLSILNKMNDDRHNPQVIPRNSTNQTGIPIFSVKPAKRPTMRPSIRSTKKPSTKRSLSPIAKPSKRPTYRKTTYPTPKPIPSPTSKPVVYPIYKNSLNPSKRPIMLYPTSKPSSNTTERSFSTLKPSKHPTHSLCSSTSGNFGATDLGKDNTLLVSYTYELYLKATNRIDIDKAPSTIVEDTVASLEVAISNQLIASLFTSCSINKISRNLQSNVSGVLGLSSSPADIVTYGKYWHVSLELKFLPFLLIP